jgi:hypothetical protein
VRELPGDAGAAAGGSPRAARAEVVVRVETLVRGLGERARRLSALEGDGDYAAEAERARLQQVVAGAQEILERLNSGDERVFRGIANAGATLGNSLHYLLREECFSRQREREIMGIVEAVGAQVEAIYGRRPA